MTGLIVGRCRPHKCTELHLPLSLERVCLDKMIVPRDICLLSLVTELTNLTYLSMSSCCITYQAILELSERLKRLRTLFILGKTLTLALVYSNLYSTLVVIHKSSLRLPFCCKDFQIFMFVMYAVSIATGQT